MSIDESSLSGSSEEDSVHVQDSDEDSDDGSDDDEEDDDEDDDDDGRVSPPSMEIIKQEWKPWVGARVRVLFDKKRWYGGKIRKVPKGTLPNGKILYDDGTNGTFCLHDSDVVVESKPPPPSSSTLPSSSSSHTKSTHAHPEAAAASLPKPWRHDDEVSLEEGEIRPLPSSSQHQDGAPPAAAAVVPPPPPPPPPPLPKPELERKKSSSSLSDHLHPPNTKAAPPPLPTKTSQLKAS